MFKYSLFCIIIYCLNPLMKFIRPFNFPHNTNMTYWNILSNNSFYKKLSVGTYVASAYRSLHLRVRDTLIDSNIVRFYGRFFGFSYSDLTRKQKDIYKLSERITPKFIFRRFNYGLLDFTRKVCKPKEPDCKNCPLKKKCSFQKFS